MRAVLRRALRSLPWAHRLRALPYSLPYRILTRALRVRVTRGRILFLSDSRAGFTGNFSFLRDELARQAPDAEVIGVFKPSLKSSRPVRDVLRLPWLMATAQTIVLDDFYPLIYPLRIRPESRLVQVWHAAGAMKRVGWSRTASPGGPKPGALTHLNYTDATVSSDGIRRDYAEAFGIDVGRVHALGVARTDAFFDPDTVSRAATDVRARYGIPSTTKIALFAPTFRGAGQRSAYYDVDQVPWTQLAAELGDDWVVLVKMHPFVEPLLVQRPGVTGVIDVTADREITELLMAADTLITDYSSAIFEYALLDRPIVLFCPDLDQYTADRDFYHPFQDYVTGPLVRDGRDLAEAIRTATAGEEIARFRTRFMSACTGQSSTRIVRDLLLVPRNAVPAHVTTTTDATAARIAAAWFTRLGINLVYGPLKLLPTRRKVLFVSREHAREPDDFADLRAALRRLDPSVRAVSLVKIIPESMLGRVAYIGHLLRQLYHTATARVLVTDTYSLVASMGAHRSALTVVQAWHALGAFKKFGLSIVGKEEGRDIRLANAMRMHRGYDMVLASSERARVSYAEAFGTAESCIVVAPLPRVDRLIDAELRAETRERIYAAHPHLRGKRIALFAPTFRLDGLLAVDVDALAVGLAEIGIHTVVKLHPLMLQAFSDAIDTVPGFSTQEMVAVADVFITDYSSTVFEAALAGLPTYFLAPDLDEYLQSRAFYLDYPDDLSGPAFETVDDLVAAITENAADAEDSLAFAAQWVTVPDSDGGAPTATVCTDHIARLLLDKVDPTSSR